MFKAIWIFFRSPFVANIFNIIYNLSFLHKIGNKDFRGESSFATFTCFRVVILFCTDPDDISTKSEIILLRRFVERDFSEYFLPSANSIFSLPHIGNF
jgi:hypothetical protein